MGSAQPGVSPACVCAQEMACLCSKILLSSLFLRHPALRLLFFLQCCGSLVCPALLRSPGAGTMALG